MTTLKIEVLNFCRLDGYEDLKKLEPLKHLEDWNTRRLEDVKAMYSWTFDELDNNIKTWKLEDLEDLNYKNLNVSRPENLRFLRWKTLKMWSSWGLEAWIPKNYNLWMLVDLEA